MKQLASILAIVLTIVATSCKKGPGEGGDSSITGYVKASDYDEKTGVLLRTQNAEDEDVYIIYGSDVSYGDKTTTGSDGKFEFKYLREGNYKIYIYSDVLPVAKTSTKQAISKSVEITDKKTTVDAGTFEINRKY
ncbi:MAG: hypothetical protein ACT4ON_09165 [Bacteroidota bacterium]